MTFFSHGFRPFFMAAGIYAAGTILYWALTLGGIVSMPVPMAPVFWHAHEMLFGYTGAALAGFFLTATPNWSGTPPVSGRPLAAVFAAWVAGRTVMWFASFLPPIVVAAADSAFLPFLLLAILPALTGNPQRQGIFVGVFAVLIASNTAFHAGVWWFGRIDPTTSLVVALDGLVLLMTVIGGRVVPNFTNNYLRTHGLGGGTHGWPWLERTIVVLTSLLIAADVTGWSLGLGAVALSAGVAHAARMAGWRSLAARREPIVWVLHAGYAWIPLGLMLRGLDGLKLAGTFDAGIHALTAGAVGTLTLAVMSRAALGHTGRTLVAAPATVVAYVLVIGGAAIRVATALGDVIQPHIGYALSAVAWAGGFAFFLAVYVPILLNPRIDARNAA